MSNSTVSARATKPGRSVRMPLNGAVQGQLIPIVVAKGMSPAQGAVLLSMWAFTASGMLLAIGYVADRGSKKMLLVAEHASSMCAMVILLVAGPTWGWTFIFVWLIAFAEGMAPANHSIIGDMFGRSAFGRLNGMLSTFTTRRSDRSTVPWVLLGSVRQLHAAAGELLDTRGGSVRRRPLVPEEPAAATGTQ